MPGRGKATETGTKLKMATAEVAQKLGLKVSLEVPFGHTIFGRARRIDVLVEDRERRRLAIECKYQGVQGTAEEKIVATLEDYRSLPIDGIVVFHGEGFSSGMRGYLMSTGRAVPFDDLEDWLRMYFRL